MVCGSENCQEEAVARAFWPGKEPIYFCPACLTRARNVAVAMGFYLHVEVLDNENSDGKTGE